jgi:hypothetical protein
VFRCLLELRPACGQRCQVEAVGLDNAAVRVAPAVAFAVRAIPGGDQPKFDQMAVKRLDLGRAKAERLLLQCGGRPDDGAGSCHPVLRAGEAEQPVDGVHHARAEAEIGGSSLEGSQHLAWFPRRFGCAGKCLGQPRCLQHGER